ncbi:MAG TPA: MoaD/ThiS family protein [Pseudonocardiaceae bacterium]|jgi:molybdopterin converting factor small subunit|nr:MoaD/ThiS family protein [Pseudonocardiaceae bacterium]
MNVTVLLADRFRSAADGAAELSVEVTEQADLGAVLDLLDARYPTLGGALRDERHELRVDVGIYVDGTECRNLDGADTALTDGAEIQVVPSVAGAGGA